MWQEPQLSKGLLINQNGSLQIYIVKIPYECKWEETGMRWDSDPSAIWGHVAKHLQLCSSFWEMDSSNVEEHLG